MTDKVLLLVLLSCLCVTLAVALTHGQADSEMVISSHTNSVQEANSDKILHREKRTIFGLLSFLVAFINAFLAINLNIQLDN